MLQKKKKKAGDIKLDLFEMRDCIKEAHETTSNAPGQGLNDKCRLSNPGNNLAPIPKIFFKYLLNIYSEPSAL